MAVMGVTAQHHWIVHSSRASSSPSARPPPLRPALFLVSQATFANRPKRDGDHSPPRRFETSSSEWRITMNAETDRDLTSEEQEQLSGGLFFVDDLPAEFADQFRHDPADITSSVARSFH
jgi:hypothetical protein